MKEDAPLHVHVGQPSTDAVRMLRAEAEKLRPVLIVVDTLFRIAKVRQVSEYAEVKRNDERRLLSAVYRDGAGTDLPETIVTLDKTTGAVALGPTRAEADEQAASLAVINFLVNQTEPVDERTIHESVEGRKSHKVRALRRLVEIKRAIRLGSGKRKDPYLYVLNRSADPTFRPGTHEVQ